MNSLFYQSWEWFAELLIFSNSFLKIIDIIAILLINENKIEILRQAISV